MAKAYRKVEGNTSLVRDMSSKAIINTNKTDYINYINNKASAIEKINKIDKQSCEISELKNDLNEIRAMLKELINK